MDPIKEKLNLLKKLAQEKKSSTQQQQHQQQQRNKQDSRLLNTDEPINHEDKELVDDVDVDEATATIAPSVDGKSVASALASNESTHNLNTTNANSLLVYDDQQPNKKPAENFYESISEMSSDANKLANTGANSMLIIGAPMSKYVNRIKDFYDKERASSTESLGSKSGFNTNRSANLLRQIKQQQQQNAAVVAPLAVPETTGNPASNTNNDDLTSDIDDSSIFSAASSAVANTARPTTSLFRSNKYINNLRNTFSSTSMRSDSIENLKRNSFNSFHPTASGLVEPSNVNQVDRLKEKFTKINQDQDRPNTNRISNVAQHIEPTLSPPPPTQESTSGLISRLDEKITKDASPSPLYVNNEPLTVNNAATPAPVNAATLRSGPAVKKYQRSKTSDLTDFIDFNKSDEPIVDDQLKQQQFTPADRRAALKNFEFDALISKYGFDKKYHSENAIIKSTMFLDRIKTSIFIYLFILLASCKGISH